MRDAEGRLCKVKRRRKDDESIIRRHLRPYFGATCVQDTAWTHRHRAEAEDGTAGLTIATFLPGLPRRRAMMMRPNVGTHERTAR